MLVKRSVRVGLTRDSSSFWISSNPANQKFAFAYFLFLQTDPCPPLHRGVIGHALSITERLVEWACRRSVNHKRTADVSSTAASCPCRGYFDILKCWFVVLCNFLSDVRCDVCGKVKRRIRLFWNGARSFGSGVAAHTVCVAECEARAALPGGKVVLCRCATWHVGGGAERKERSS